MRRKILLTVLLLLLPKFALAAASVSITVKVIGPPATAVSCTIAYPSGQTSFTSPVVANTLVCPLSVTPVGWQGAFAISGTDAADFAINGTNLTFGNNGYSLPSGQSSATLNITVTASP